MRTRKTLFGALASIAVLAACNPEEQNLGTPDLTLSVTEITFDEAGGSEKLSLNATRDWMVETDADWVVVNPESGAASADDQTVTVTVLENTGMDRVTDLKFTIGMKSKYLTVSQAGPGGSAEALVVYANDMNKGKVEKVNDYWPYPEQTDSWRNEIGNGVANVTYASDGVSVRSVSSTNNIWFPAKGGSYFSIQNISLNSATSLQLSFDVVHGSPNGYKKAFSTDVFKVFVSKDNTNWVELPYELIVNADNEFDTGAAKFTVGATETLSVTFQFLGAEDGYRLTDIILSVYDGDGAVAVDFSQAVEKDFGAGSSSEPGTGDLPEGTGEGTETSPYDAAKATHTASALGADDKITGVYVKGIIKSIKEVNLQYGNATYYITDADGAANFYVYRGKNVGNTAFTAEDQITVGDEVVIYGDLMNYMGNSPQLGQGNYIVKHNGNTAGEGGETPDVPSDATEVSVAEFLAATESETVEYILTGAITLLESYNSSYSNTNLTIKDETGSVYAYRLAMEQSIYDDLNINDVITIKGNRGAYNSTPQMTNGVYVSHENKEAPAEAIGVTLTFPDGNQKAISSYTDTWEAVSDNHTWTLTAFNNNKNDWSYVKCGRKADDSVASISVNIESKVSKVCVTIDKCLNEAKVKSAKLYVASDANFSTIVETIEGSAAAGVQEYTITNPAAGLYYKLEYDCLSHGSSNGIVQISKVVCVTVE